MTAVWSPPEPFVTSDYARLHVVENGPSDAATTVVLAHGWTLDHTLWDRVTLGLCADVRVLRYDHRGHGRSTAGPAGSATIERLADDLAELLVDRVPTGRVVLAGHSLGGMTIMALAERHPALVASRVAGVAFVATSAGGLTDRLFGLSPRASAAALRLADRAGARAVQRGKLIPAVPPVLMRPDMRIGLFGKRAAKADMNATTEQFTRADVATLVGIQTSFAQHNRVAVLTAFASMPVVVLAGGRDGLTPVRHARAIAEALPHARFALYPKAGHMLPYERTAQVTERIQELARA